jgi:acetolactate synthase-1/2/3 large subunit
VKQAADWLIAAGAPMIHAGSGIIHCHAYDALRRVAELLHAPVTTSWAARGMLAETRRWPSPCPTSSSTTRCATTPTWC